MNQMLKKLIAFFVGKTRGHITKIQLVKFLYLADLYAVKWTSQQLTDLDWRYYLHGPWSEEIDRALSLMAGHEVIVERRGKAILIRPGPALEEVELPISVALMLENIRREWAGERIDELLSYVYSTAPMVEAQEKYRQEELAPLNLMREQERLEKMLAEGAWI